MMCGGHSQSHPANAEVQEMLNHHKEHILAQLAIGHHDIKAISYTTQVVAGTNYKVLVEISGKHYSVTIFKSLPDKGTETKVTSVEHVA